MDNNSEKCKELEENIRIMIPEDLMKFEFDGYMDWFRSICVSVFHNLGRLLKK